MRGSRSGLPLRQNGRTLSTASSVNPKMRELGRTQILVVDDDPNLLRMLRRGLILAGYAVDAVEDGEAALRVARDDEPDLVVLDVMLPEPLDGLEVARRLRAAGSEV